MPGPIIIPLVPKVILDRYCTNQWRKWNGLPMIEKEGYKWTCWICGKDGVLYKDLGFYTVPRLSNLMHKRCYEGLSAEERAYREHRDKVYRLRRRERRWAKEMRRWDSRTPEAGRARRRYEKILRSIRSASSPRDEVTQVIKGAPLRPSTSPAPASFVKVGRRQMRVSTGAVTKTSTRRGGSSSKGGTRRRST